MRDTDLKTLRLFVAVCDHRNIAQAAAEAHIEPSAISKRIAQLEGELGVPLLSRSRRGVQPTAAGSPPARAQRALHNRAAGERRRGVWRSAEGARESVRTGTGTR